MQTVITIAIISALSLIVVLGLLSVLKDLLDRFVESPLMLVNDSDLRDDLPDAIAAPIVEPSDRLREQRSKAGIQRRESVASRSCSVER
jgi:hypothetical protein